MENYLNKCKYCGRAITISEVASGDVVVLGYNYDLFHVACGDRHDNSVYVGYDCFISKEWIPEGVSTGIFDINGKEILTSNIVSLVGCTSSVAVVGLTESGFKLFFGSVNGSVQWDLCSERVESNKVSVMV